MALKPGSIVLFDLETLNLPVIHDKAFGVIHDHADGLFATTYDWTVEVYPRDVKLNFRTSELVEWNL